MPKPLHGHPSYRSKFTKRERKRTYVDTQPVTSNNECLSDLPGMAENHQISVNYFTIDTHTRKETHTFGDITNVVSSSDFASPSRRLTFNTDYLNPQQQLSVLSSSFGKVDSCTQTDAMPTADPDGFLQIGTQTDITFLFDESSETDNKRENWSKEETTQLLHSLLQVGCTKFPRKRFIGYKGNSVQYAVFCCLYSIMRNKLPTFNRSLFSIYKKCANLYDNTKKDLSKSGITFSSDEEIFSACLHAYSVDNVTDSQTLSVENVWSFLTDCNPAISHTLASLFLQISKHEDFNANTFASRVPNLFTNILNCLSADKVLFDEGLSNIMYSLAKIIANRQFPLKSVLFNFFEENIRFFSLENTSGMWYIEKQRCCGKQPVNNLVIQSLGFFRLETHRSDNLFRFSTWTF